MEILQQRSNGNPIIVTVAESTETVYVFVLRKRMTRVERRGKRYDRVYEKEDGDTEMWLLSEPGDEDAEEIEEVLVFLLGLLLF